MAKTIHTASDRLSPGQADACVDISPERLVNEIKDKAHSIYLQRGDANRSALDDWLQAEREVKAKFGIKA